MSKKNVMTGIKNGFDINIQRADPIRVVAVYFFRKDYKIPGKAVVIYLEQFHTAS